MRIRSVALALSFSILLVACTGDSPEETKERKKEAVGEVDLVQLGCEVDPTLLDRIWRGYDKQRSEDIIMLPKFPNYSGTFAIPNHSGPWDYLQNVPLVFYGPGIIKPTGQVTGPASVVDIFPTFGELTGVDLPERTGRALTEMIEPDAPTPKLVILLVWDGAGRNVLERWPDAWPTLARLEREGTSYVDAVVGSSPSITPAIHSSMGTGLYPRAHRVTGIKYTLDSGEVGVAFQGRDASVLDVATFGDLIDIAFQNAPKVGLLGWRSWHMGMFSHGSAWPGGDKDMLALFEEGNAIGGNDELYYTPDYLREAPGLDEAVQELDRLDGELDGKWMSHDILEMHDNPAWSNFQSEVLLSLISGEGFGADAIPDLLSVNYKMSDIVGHQHTMDSPEMEATVRSQDEGLARLIELLDDTVGDYVIAMTSDHGHTPSPERTGAWAIANGQLKEDIDAFFETPSGKSLVRDTSAVGIFFDEEVGAEMGVTMEDVSRFVLTYTIEENHDGDELPEEYRDRAKERVFEAAFPGTRLAEILECAGRN
jgi:predicted AlkP superfamily pyrophosphatase or phosphodiesterase